MTNTAIASENDESRPTTSEDECYEDYSSAYRTGHEGYDRYPNKSFDEVETELKQDYASIVAETGEDEASWEEARESVRDAWDQSATT